MVAASTALAVCPPPFLAAGVIAAAGIALATGGWRALARNAIASSVFLSPYCLVWLASGRVDRDLPSLAIEATRLFALLCVASAAGSGARPSGLRDAATWMWRKAGFPEASNLGLALSLILGMIPEIRDEWGLKREAEAARGARRRGFPLVGPLGNAFSRSVIKAGAVAEALAARGHSAERVVDFPPLSGRDKALVVTMVILAAGAITGTILT